MKKTYELVHEGGAPVNTQYLVVEHQESEHTSVRRVVAQCAIFHWAEHLVGILNAQEKTTEALNEVAPLAEIVRALHYHLAANAHSTPMGTGGYIEIGKLGSTPISREAIELWNKMFGPSDRAPKRSKEVKATDLEVGMVVNAGGRVRFAFTITGLKHNSHSDSVRVWGPNTEPELILDADEIVIVDRVKVLS